MYLGDFIGPATPERKQFLQLCSRSLPFSDRFVEYGIPRSLVPIGILFVEGRKCSVNVAR